jgi:hypothetical protein
MAAYELGLKDPNELRLLIKNNARMQALGLKPLTQGETIKRETWESLDNLPTIFQEVASELDLGTPYRQR